MNNYGCFARGTTAIAVSYSEMEVTTGIGHNTKRNPKKAVDTISKEINKKSEYPNKVLIEILPTAVIPNLPGFGQKNIIYSKKIGNSFIKLLPIMTKLNFGFDRADEIIEHLSKRFKDSVIVGGCTMDDNKMLRNYQFYSSEIKNNSLLVLNISIPNKIYTETIIGLKNLDVSFIVDNISKDKHVIKKIDGNGARSSLFKKLNLKIEEKADVYQLYKNAFYYPLGFKKENVWHAGMIGLIYGENLVFANKIENSTLTLLSLSIENIMKNLNESVNNLSEKNISFVLGFACETFIETLRNNIFEIQKSFEKLKVPYLIPFMAGESIYTPKLGSHHLYESLNILAIGDENIKI